MSKVAESGKDFFSTCQNNVNQYFDSIEKSLPNYIQSVSNMQQEYAKACKTAWDTTITMQKEFSKKAGINTNIPENTAKAISDANEGVTKAIAVQNQVILATVDATRQSIKAINENSKTFAELNRNIAQNWTNFFTQTKN